MIRLAPRRRAAWLGAAGAALLLLVAPARADGGEGVPYYSGWLQVRGGAAVGMGIAGDVIDVSEDLRGSPAFGVGVSWRLPAVDLGALVEHVGGSHFTFRGDVLRMSGQVRAALDVRWRFLEGPMGSLYFSLRPGWSGMRIHPRVRDAVAGELEDLSRGDVSGRASGFSFGSGIGLILYATRRLGFFLEAEGLVSIARIEVGDDRLPLIMNRSLIGLGVVWRP